MVNQSKELTEFYRAYAKWLDEGAPHMQPFVRDDGLCINIRKMVGYRFGLRAEMQEQFIQHMGKPMFYPFNVSKSCRPYLVEANAYECHLNPARIQWVRDHCNPVE